MVGHLLRRHRMDAGLTQKELAAHCQERGMGMTRGTLAKIEARIRFVKACELFVIARILNLPVDKFFPSKFGQDNNRKK